MMLSALSVQILSQPHPVCAAAQVIIRDNHSYYNDTSANLYVIGEMRNAGDVCVSAVDIELTFYDSNGKVIGNSSTIGRPMLPTVPQDKTVPFKISKPSSSEEISKIDHYSLNVKRFSAGACSLNGSVLKFTYLWGGLSTDGKMFIVQGRMKNNGTFEAKENNVIASCYDATGRILLTANYSEIHDKTIVSGKAEYFWIYFNEENIVGKVSGFSVLASSSYPAGTQIAYLDSGLIQTPTSTTSSSSTSSSTSSSSTSSSSTSSSITSTYTYTSTTSESSSTTSTSQPGLGCVIATAAYGSEMASEVVYMRHVRDDMIGSNELGRTIVSGWNLFYYSWSTPIARLIASHDLLRPAFRILLLPIIGTVHITAYTYSTFSVINSTLAAVIAFLLAALLSTAIYVLVPVLAIRTLYSKRRMAARARLSLP